MAVSTRGKRKITVNNRQYLWRVHRGDLEIINPQTRVKLTFNRTRRQDETWSEKARDLLRLWNCPEDEVTSLNEMSGLIEIAVSPALVRTVILRDNP